MRLFCFCMPIYLHLKPYKHIQSLKTMKKRLQNSFLPLTIAFVLAGSIIFSSCNKDETCGLHINIVDSLNIKQRFVWVVIDIPENTPPSQTGAAPSTDFPIQLNTRTDGFVECEFKLPAIVQANVYDSVDYQLLNPIKKKIIKLEPGETVTESIAIN